MGISEVTDLEEGVVNFVGITTGLMTFCPKEINRWQENRLVTGPLKVCKAERQSDVCVGNQSEIGGERREPNALRI